MRHRFLLPLLALAAILPAHALQMKIESADADNTTWPTAVPVSRQLQYKEKEQKLVAVVEFRDDLHSNAGSAVQDDTLFFRFPGVCFDPDDQTLSVETENRAVIPIGEWRKGAFGNRQVLLYLNTVILVSKLHGHVQLTLDIDTDRTADSLDKAKHQKEQGDAAAQTYTLDSLLHAKSGGN
jgi:hypothetical protein